MKYFYTLAEHNAPCFIFCGGNIKRGDNHTSKVIKQAHHSTTMGFFIYIMSKITKELVEAGLIPALTDRRWPELLEAIKHVKVSKQSIHADFDIATRVRGVLDWLDDEFERQTADAKEQIATRKTAFDAYRKPIESFLLSVEPEFIKANNEILSEEKVVKDAIDKDNDRRNRHQEFVNETTRAIVSATDTNELVRIQKLIGTEKSKKTFYGEEYFPAIEQVCDQMLKLIDGQKQMIKDNSKLKSEKEAAEKSGDLVLTVDLKSRIEYNEMVIKENAREISQKTFEYVSSVATISDSFVSAAIKPKTHRWSYTVENIELLAQKLPELVKREENKGAIGKWIKSKTESGEIDEEKETKYCYPGITVFRKQYYVAPSK